MQSIRVVSQQRPSDPHTLPRGMLGLILTVNSFEFNGNNYLQTHELQWAQKQQCLLQISTCMLYMAEIETNLIQQSNYNAKPREWKRYIDDVFSLCDCNRKDVGLFIKEDNNFHPTVKFKAEISENEITFLDTTVLKGERFTEKSISKPTISRLKPFIIPTLPRATLQG